MIERIQLTGVATYGANPVILDGLTTFNYCYGANASGKTTISRVIHDETAFPTCSVSWKTGTRLEALVYNRDFIDTHFRESDEFPGIFTLGEKNAEAITKIAAAKTEVEKLAADIATLKRTLQGEDGQGGKVGELQVLEDTLKDACWKQKQTYDEQFQAAFHGYRNSAEKFKTKVLAEKAGNKAEKKSLDYLTDKAATVFAEDVAQIAALPTVDTQPLLDCEASSVLAKKVIGKTDVDIAAMITRLGNSDWVRAGREYFEENDSKCPFCQQSTQDAFAESLQAYFDESFEADSKAIDTLVNDYLTEATAITNALDAILADPPILLDGEALAGQKKLLDANIKINQQRLQSKQKEPSRSLTLESSAPIITDLSRILADANTKIAAHNDTVKNLAKERKTLIAQIWKFLLEEPLASELASYDSKRDALDKAAANLNRQIREKETSCREKEAEIRALERDVTSIRPTIDAINGLLRSFGFHGFSLAEADDKRSYKLVRTDGSDAKATLSEGEKTFVTFLYFYHLLKGSPSESGITNDRVVVFDDPVSSLDSDILFIVSTLIRRLCDEVREGTSNVKQVFLFTHNVFFHKEVTFNKKRPSDRKLNEETFWTVRKVNHESQVTSHPSNPIKSSYELLWLEIRERKEGNLSIQNSLRRILETYFKLLGGIDLDQIQDKFEGNEKLACRALLSWVNDGSHSAHDDLYVAVDETTIDLYLNVFRRIFEGQNHIDHYNMMMAGPTTSAPAP